MATRNTIVDREGTTRRFLTAADYFLRHGNFADCRSYALRARDSDPSHPEPNRMLSIVSVLSAPNISPTLRDYYAILKLPRLESNAARIWSSFEKLESTLNPKVNRYPQSSEAYDLVLKAWSVLSDPIGKAKYDDEMRRSLGGCTFGVEHCTFWTMCPYCYYVYEYDKDYEDCCLRCTNERCRRVLQAVPIGAPPPPPEVVERGYYLCPGFMQFQLGNDSGQEIRENLWVPFAHPRGPSNDWCDYSFKNNGRGRAVGKSAGAENTETVEEVDRGEEIECQTSYNGENVEIRGGSGIGVNDNGLKEEKKRRKMYVHWDSNKLMGRGIKVDMNEAHSVYGVCEAGHSNMDENGGEDLDPGFGGKTRDGTDGGIEFFEGDNDVLVGLQCDNDVDQANEGL